MANQQTPTSFSANEITAALDGVQLPDIRKYNITTDALNRLKQEYESRKLANPGESAEEMNRWVSAELRKLEGSIDTPQMQATGKQAMERAGTAAKKVATEILPSADAMMQDAVMSIGEIWRLASEWDLAGAKRAGETAQVQQMEKLRAVWNVMKDGLGSIPFLGDLLRMFLPGMMENTSEGGVGTSRSTEPSVPHRPVTVPTAPDLRKSAENLPEKIEKMTQGIARDISQRYFGGRPLGNDQVDRIRKMVKNNIPKEDIDAVLKRYQDTGKVQIGEAADATMGSIVELPMKLMYEIAFSGIIPVWAIANHLIVRPTGTMMQLTLDGWGLPVEMSIDAFTGFLHKKMESGDEHALDLARIQLYGVNGIIWKVLGGAVSVAAGLGIMLTDTVSGADGIKLANGVIGGNSEKVLAQLTKIETMLHGNTPPPHLKDYTALLKDIGMVKMNGEILRILAEEKTNAGVLERIQKVSGLDLSKEAIKKLWSLSNQSQEFHRSIVGLMYQPQGTARSYGKVFGQMMAKWSGGASGATLNYLDTVQTVLHRQVELANSQGLKTTVNTIKSAWSHLKLARSADTLNLHLETAEDVSRFRSFLAVIPGGIRGLAEVLPAGALVISLGSIGWDAANHEKDEATGKRFLEALGMALLPVYGSVTYIRSREFGLKDALAGEVSFTDLALTGTIGAVGLYEAGRVATGLYQMWAGALTGDGGKVLQGFKKVTYLHDIGRSTGIMARGARNIMGATRPVVQKMLTQILTRSWQGLAHHAPRRLAPLAALGALALVGAGTAYARYAGTETDPAQVEASLRKKGHLTASGTMSYELRDQITTLDPARRKEFFDSLFVVTMGDTTGCVLPQTRYVDGAYEIITQAGEKYPKALEEIASSDFRTHLRSLGADIRIVPIVS